MKKISEQILNTINEEYIKTTFNGHISSDPNLMYGDTSITEAYDKFILIKDILDTSIKSSQFDTLPVSRRNSILSAVNSVRTYITNPSQTIIQIDILYESILGNELLIQQINKRDYVKELKNISDLKNKLENLLLEINDKQNVLKYVDEASMSIKKVKEDIDNYNLDIVSTVSDIQKHEKVITEIQSAVTNTQTLVQQSEKEVETKKLSINTFAENIEEYKSSISALENQSKLIVAKEGKINELIGQAETALNLKSAEGISAAFSSQYTSANQKWGLRTWTIGAVVFILIAITLTIWIVSGKWIHDPNSISSIIGRIVAVGIAITGATFCAQQYTKQKNIAEDYAYKAVLSKSIIAFTEEIRKRDDNKVAVYLEKVLSEIHQDPLRKRSDKDENENLIKPLSIVDKLIEKIPSK